MPRFDWVRETGRPSGVRAQQLSGMFDIPPDEKLRHEWHVDAPLDERDWNIGLIVGPSGCGKTSMLETMSGQPQQAQQWSTGCLLDDFPENMGIKDIVGLLCAIGFSSPPDWLKPYDALSNGQKFRVSIARMLAEQSDGIAYIDEFTSVVDRDVAKIASAAIAKHVRHSGARIVVASCHYDVQEWLTPDWICQPHLEQFDWCECLQRPSIELEIRRVHHSAWAMFAPHHYLSRKLNKSARCYVAFWNDKPVAFLSALVMVGNFNTEYQIWREHRTVCLPDYQGVGIGSRLSDTFGAILRALQIRWKSTTSHPAMIAHRTKSNKWTIMRKRGFTPSDRKAAKYKAQRAVDRLTCGFEYVGPSWPDIEQARALWDGA